MECMDKKVLIHVQPVMLHAAYASDHYQHSVLNVSQIFWQEIIIIYLITLINVFKSVHMVNMLSMALTDVSFAILIVQHVKDQLKIVWAAPISIQSVLFIFSIANVLQFVLMVIGWIAQLFLIINVQFVMLDVLSVMDHPLNNAQHATIRQWIV